MLGGLAAGAAQAGNLPHFGHVLSSAAAGGRQATQKAQQRRIENALTQARTQAALLEAQGEDNLRSGFTRGPNGEIMLQPGYAKAVRKLNEAKRSNERARLLSTEEKQQLVENGQLPESYMRFPVQRLDDGRVEVMTPQGVSLSVGEDGSIDFRSGSQLTTSETSRRQKQVDQAVGLINNLQTLGSKIEKAGASGAGPIGAFQGLINKTVANFAPSTFSRDRAAFETWTNATRESALSVVSDESRFSDTDRQYIMNLFPKTGPFTSPEAAAHKVKVMTAFMTKRLQDQLKDAGADVDVDLTPEQVRGMFNEGYLSEDQAADTLMMLFPERFGGNNG
jgi:hypothetical protein